METPSATRVFKGLGDARKFFYVFENVITKEQTEIERADKICEYPSGDAFDFYFERFTMDNKPTQDATVYSTVKEVMLDKFSTKKTEAEVMKEAINLVYDGGDVNAFIAKADKLYTKAKFNGVSKLGLIREALKTDQMMLQFVLLRGAKDYQSVKDTCLEYAENKKILAPDFQETTYQQERKEDPTSKKVDELTKRLKELTLNAHSPEAAETTATFNCISPRNQMLWLWRNGTYSQSLSEGHGSSSDLYLLPSLWTSGGSLSSEGC